MHSLLLLVILDVFSLCVLVEQSVTPTSSSLVVPCTVLVLNLSDTNAKAHKSKLTMSERLFSLQRLFPVKDLRIHSFGELSKH